MCNICKYNQRQDVERALLSGTSLAILSRRYGFPVPELERHQVHLQQKMARMAKRYQAYLHQGLQCKLNTVMEITLSVIRKTRNDPDPKLFLQAGREYTRMVALMHKITHRLAPDPEFVYCLMASRQWDQQDDALLPYAFQALNQTRQSMQLHLFEPCPKPQPEPVPASYDPEIKPGGMEAGNYRKITEKSAINSDPSVAFL